MHLALVLGTCIFLLSYSVILFFYKNGWDNIPTFEDDAKNANSNLFISIIVPARNEEDNIVQLIHAIRQQTYPKDRFEVIIIDDHSTDNTCQNILAHSCSNIRLLFLKEYINKEETIAFKKKAIEIGVAHAKGSLIITTDADCTMNAQWLSTIAAFCNKMSPKMLVMPVAIQQTHSWLSIFQCLDFMCLQGITGAAIFKKWHGMGNGANLAYTKQAFEEVRGFETVDHIASGDDFFLIQKMKKKFPDEVYYLKSAPVIVTTSPANNISQFFQQRIRWASKANKYLDKSLFPILLIVYLLNLFLFLLLIDGLLFPVSLRLFLNIDISLWEWSMLFLILKTIVELFFLYKVAHFFKKASLLFWFPFFQPLHIIYTIIAGLLGGFGKYQWKDRMVK